MIISHVNMCHQLLLWLKTSSIELHQVSSWRKSSLISGGDSSCSWVLVYALGLSGNKELQAVMLGGELELWGSSLAPVPLQYR